MGSGAGPEVAANYGQLPLHFEPNVGQTDGQVRFLARGSGMTAFFTDTETVMVLGRSEQTVVRMKLERAGRPRQAAGVEKLPGISNYFIGSDPAKWRTDVPQYARIQYEGVYPGIDLVWYGNRRQLEYDFVVAPGADAEQIQVAYEGVESLGVESNGDLILRTALGEMRQQKPRVYQEIGGKRVDVAAGYAVVAHNRVGFELAGYDRKWELRIDPVVLVYSTYLGGSGDDEAQAIAVDQAGSAYVTGSTTSTNFPTQSPYQGTFQGGRSDVFVTKLASGGNALLYSTYLGGNGSDACYAIAVDAAGSAYVTGSTTSTNFPTQSPYQATFQGSQDAFVTKLAPAGNALAYSTYLGGSVADAGHAIAVDGAGSAYVTGSTTSTNFPTQSPYQGTYGGNSDAFVTKLASAGNALLYSTYLGGSGFDGGNAITVDGAGSAYVTGYTSSTNYPTQSPYQATFQGGTYDAFVTKLVFQAATSQIATITTVAGSGSLNPSVSDGGPAISAGIPYPFDLDVDGRNNLYFINGGYAIDRIDTSTVYRVTQAGTVSSAFALTPGIPMTYAAQAVGIPATGAAAYVAVASAFGNSVVRLDSKGQTAIGSNWTFDFPLMQSGGVGVRYSNASTYVADALNNRIIKIGSNNSAAIIGGTGVGGYSGDGGTATQARFNSPSAVAIDASGNVFVADSGNQCIRTISAAGTASTVAGICTQGGFSGDAGAATAAKLSAPGGLAVGPDGSIYVSDTGNNRIRRVNPNGTIETIAGIGNATFPNGVSSCFDDPFSAACFFGDGGDATLAVLNGPRGIALDSQGRLYIADTKNNRIRMLSFGPKPGTPPVITGVGVSGGGANIAQNAWVSIYGTNLAPASDAGGFTWSTAPSFASGVMPTELDGVSVTVNGIPAYVYFICSTQINVLTPLDSTVGPVAIVVNNGTATSAAYTANLQAVSPGLLRFGDFIHIVAQHADWTFVGPASMSSPGYTFTPAVPGEVIALYGDGFGLPVTTLTAGSMYQSGLLPEYPQITIGGIAATVQYAAVISPGLYQINVLVPAVPSSGDTQVIATYGGVSSPAGAMIPVEQ